MQLRTNFLCCWLYNSLAKKEKLKQLQEKYEYKSTLNAIPQPLFKDQLK